MTNAATRSIGMEWILILGIALVLTASCSRSRGPAPVVQLIFPVGYSGVVRVSEDREGGLTARPQNGTIIIDIPEDGELRLANIRVLLDWHQLKARYRTGEEIRVVSDDSSVAPNDVVLWRSTYYPTREMFYLLGTADDWEEFEQDIRARFGFPPRNGSGG